MFRDPVYTRPFVQDVSDVNLRLRIQRADSALFHEPGMRFPNLRIW